jgi:hypothetical protein
MACPLPSYCTAPECEEPTRQGRTYCDLHEKRHQRCRCASAARCQCLTAPKQERLGPKERLLEAAHRYAETDAEDDAEYQRNERDLLRAARQIQPSAMGELVRHGMAEARRRGVRLGRRPSVTPEQAREAVQRHGSIAAAARALGRNRDTISDALKRAEESSIVPHSSMAA